MRDSESPICQGRCCDRDICGCVNFRFFSAPFAAAQEEKPKQETAQDEKARGEYELGTMTVTAQKQEENVQEVPMSITVFDSLDIEDKKIESIRDMADFVPNLMIYQHGLSGQNSPTMRGITARPATGLQVLIRMQNEKPAQN